MRKTKEESELTRQAILQSALNIFYEKGYSKTTFDEIAKRINLTKGAVYWYFRHKPDLIAALINEHLSKRTAEIEQKLPIIRSFNDILQFFYFLADDILKDDNSRKLVFFMVCQMEWSEAIITKVLPQVEKNKEYGLEKVKEGLTFLQKSGEISAATDINHLTHIIMNIWSGTLDAYLGKRCPTDLKTMLQESLNLIFNGLKKEGTENAGNKTK